jgi:hypothetical protein
LTIRDLFCNVGPPTAHYPAMTRSSAHHRIAVAIAVACVALAEIPAASANTVVVLGDAQQDGGLVPALEVALSAQRVHVSSMPSPTGALRLERAAAAQRTARTANANAAVWVDADAGSFDVCVVSADSGTFRHAPMPEPSPRVFAAIATSLLDELLAPAGSNLAVDVNVSVNVGADGPVTTIAPVDVTMVPTRMSSNAPGVVASIDDPATSRRDRTIFEIGPMLSPIAVGLEGSLMVPTSSTWRAGVNVGATIPFDAPDRNGPIVVPSLELRHIGIGRRHFDLGALAGGIIVTGATQDSALFAGARLGWTWEGERRGTSLSFAPIVFFVPGEVVLPGLWASWRWSLAI